LKGENEYPNIMLKKDKVKLQKGYFTIQNQPVQE